MKVCECGSGYIPSYYPSGEMSEPDKNENSFVMGIIPAWVCSSCGTNELVSVEEKMDWLGAAANFQRRLVRTINIAEHMLAISPELRELMEGKEDARSVGKIH